VFVDRKKISIVIITAAKIRYFLKIHAFFGKKISKMFEICQKQQNNGAFQKKNAVISLFE